jgi:uncharacterized delta-60 repeat protein
MKLDGKGRIILVGKTTAENAGRRTDFAIVRYTENGELDTGFNKSGYQKYPVDERWNIAVSVAVSPDSSFLIAGGYALYANGGRDPLMVRFREDGSVDRDFVDNAKAALRKVVSFRSPANVTGVAIDKQGGCLAVMPISLNNRLSWGLARVRPDGTIDDEFAKDGLWNQPLDEQAENEGPYGVEIDDSGKIVVGGFSANSQGIRCLAVARFDARGNLDKSFGSEGKGFVIFQNYGSKVANLYGPRLAVARGRIAVAGIVADSLGRVNCFGVGVLDDDGKTTATLEPRELSGSVGTDLPWAVTIDAQNRILVAGFSYKINQLKRAIVARYTVK